MKDYKYALIIGIYLGLNIIFKVFLIVLFLDYINNHSYMFKVDLIIPFLTCLFGGGLWILFDIIKELYENQEKSGSSGA